MRWLTAAQWRWTRRLLVAGFALLVAMLLYGQGRNVDWGQVRGALAGISPGVLGLAALITIASYLLYGCFDLAARRHIGHCLSTQRVLGIAAVAYAFSLNLGALVGGAGFRMRLYMRAGLGGGTAARIIVFAVATNWAGYLLIGGLLFVSGVVEVPTQWPVGSRGLRVLGMALLLLALGYLLACHMLQGRQLHVRGHSLELPALQLALLQMLLASFNWTLMAALLWLFMPSGMPFAPVLGTLLVAAVASAIAHVPAGLGVIEAVFLPLLAHYAPVPSLLAALLAWRALYYVGPLLLALAGYGWFEMRGQGARHAA